jgi:SAM-dependent methyltransferase
VTERFSAAWLALREPFDHAARSVALARRLAEVLPKRPRLIDLGAGTGSMFRFLAPIIGRGQDWTLVDMDGAVLDEAFGRTAAWARRRGYAATAPGDELLVSTPKGLWRMRTLNALLPPSADAQHCDAILCSALLDLVSAPWLGRLCDTLKVPFLACLNVDGRDSWLPRHPFDALVRTAFRRDMHRDKGSGAALGTSAPGLLTARKLVTASAPADWRIPGTALRMQQALIEGTAGAARNACPGRAPEIGEWEQARLRQAIRGRLAIRIGHRDILAFPPGG